ncbi:ABC transporter substrate-binding protein [Bartonella sp. DGB1]|uniref:ABC transporter substrate-binding protein n=1 Tax=Bartonella sp. DGB1 TaxID=3239807 RepID=UPI00352602D9
MDKAVTLVIADHNIAYNRFLAGELDVVGVGAPKPLYERAKKEYGDKILTFPNLFVSYLGINVKRMPDVRVRKALQLGIDRDIITDKILGSGQVPAFNYVPSNIKNGNYPQPEWANWTKQQRHKEAKRLLAEAGYNEKNPYKFKLSYSTGEVATTIAVALQSMYKRNIGVNVSLENMEWKTFLQEREAGNLETWFIGGSAGFNDASTFLVPYVSDASYNVAKYNNPMFDEYMAQSYLATDPAKRDKLLEAAHKIIIEESVVIPLFNAVSNVIVKPWVKNYVADPFGKAYPKWLELEGFPKGKK